MKRLVIFILFLLFANNLFAFTDNDNDGMMDSWETKYSLNNPNSDADSDGLKYLSKK